MPKTSKIRSKGSNYTNAPAPSRRTSTVYRCTRCGREHAKQKGLFPSSQSPLFKENNGYLPICTICVDELFDKYKAKLPSEDFAMRRMCMMFDLYWSPSLFETVKKNEETGLSLIRTYISKMNLAKYNGKTFDNTLDEERFAEAAELVSQPMTQQPVEEAPAKPTKKKQDAMPSEAPAPSADTILFWGTGFTPEIYQDLNLRYQAWTRDLPKPLDMGVEALYKQLCLQQVNVNLNMMSGKSIDGSQKVISDILAKLGISPDQQTDEDEASIIESTPMGLWIRRWEDKRPLPEEDEDMKDHNNVIRYIHTWFFGHIGKMLGIKSPYTKMYEDEINKFRVERPDLADVDDDDIINDEFGEGDGVDDE